MVNFKGTKYYFFWFFVKIICVIIRKGKKQVAVRNFKRCCFILRFFYKQNPIKVILKAVLNLKPFVFVVFYKKNSQEYIKRVFTDKQKMKLAIHWLVSHSNKKTGFFSQSLAYEIYIASKKKGKVFDKKYMFVKLW